MAIRQVLEVFENNLRRLNEIGVSDVSRKDYSDGIGKQPGLCHEIIHVQLMFWTLVLSVVYSYACKQYRKRFIVCFFLFLPLSFFVCCIISYVLFVVVVLGHLLTSDCCKNLFTDSSQERYRPGSLILRDHYSSLSISSDSLSVSSLNI